MKNQKAIGLGSCALQSIAHGDFYTRQINER